MGIVFGYLRDFLINSILKLSGGIELEFEDGTIT